MRRFKSFIREMAEVSIASLNPDFLKRAQKVTSFNLRGSDFESLKYKAEIQYLFRTFFFLVNYCELVASVCTIFARHYRNPGGFSRNKTSCWQQEHI